MCCYCWSCHLCEVFRERRREGAGIEFLTFLEHRLLPRNCNDVAQPEGSQLQHTLRTAHDLCVRARPLLWSVSFPSLIYRSSHTGVQIPVVTQSVSSVPPSLPPPPSAHPQSSASSNRPIQLQTSSHSSQPLSRPSRSSKWYSRMQSTLPCWVGKLSALIRGARMFSCSESVRRRRSMLGSTRSRRVG